MEEGKGEWQSEKKALNCCISWVGLLQLAGGCSLIVEKPQ